MKNFTPNPLGYIRDKLNKGLTNFVVLPALAFTLSTQSCKDKQSEQDQNHPDPEMKLVKSVEPDFETFTELLENEYGKDSKNVFYWNFNQFDKDVFVLLEKNPPVTRTEAHEEKWWKHIKWADPETFEIILTNGYNEGYAKDKNNVYLRLKENVGWTSNIQWKTIFMTIEWADPESFEVINRNYSKDKNNVYFRGNKIEWADSESFEYLGGGYYVKDKNNCYYGWYHEPVERADPKSFEVISGKYAKDKNSVFYGWKPIDWVNPKNITFINNKSFDVFMVYSKNLYCWPVMVPWVDVKSFKFDYNWCDWSIHAEDWKYIYYFPNDEFFDREWAYFSRVKKDIKSDEHKKQELVDGQRITSEY